VVKKPRQHWFQQAVQHLNHQTYERRQAPVIWQPIGAKLLVSLMAR